MKKIQVFTLFLSLGMFWPALALAKPKISVKKEREIAARIDAIIDLRLKEAGFTPNTKAGDMVLLRRLSLDLTGVTPQPETVVNFRKLHSKKKLDFLIDKLINSPRFANHMADRLIRSWIGWRRGQSYLFFKDWLVKQILAKRPLDAIVQDIVNSRNSSELGPRIFNTISRGQSTVLANDSAQAFMGLQIGCAQCHDHPFSNWKQKQFHEYAAYFAIGQHSYTTLKGFQNFKPRFPFNLGVKDPLKSTQRSKKRRITKLQVVAKLITHPKNPYFAKSTVNRLWKSFLGQGLIEPVDDLEQAQGPYSEVLDLLSKEFVRGGYNLRSLVRIIVRLQAYQRSSVQDISQSENDPGRQLEEARKAKDSEKIEEALARIQLGHSLLQRGSIRLLTPQQIVSSILRASGIEPTYSVNRRGSKGDWKSYILLKRQMIARFEKLYDDKSPAPGVFEGTVRQKLVLFNDSFINEAMKATQGSMLSLILREGRSKNERIRAIFMAVLGRKPSKEEMRGCLGILKGGSNGIHGYEDLMWALMNSSEFLMNH